MPYLDSKDRFDAYKFDEPWNGPNNKTLAQHRPDAYDCPSDKGAHDSPETTSYLAVVGPDTIWSEHLDPNRQPVAGMKRISVIEAADSGINWMEPMDLTQDEALRGVNSGAGLGISSQHGNGANVAFTDGSVEFVPSGTSQVQILEMLKGITTNHQQKNQ